MNETDQNSEPILSYLIEHSRGTCELWVRCVGLEDCSYEPVRLVRISGMSVPDLDPSAITQAIELDEWVADHFDVFREGRTVYDET